MVLKLSEPQEDMLCVRRMGKCSAKWKVTLHLKSCWQIFHGQLNSDSQIFTYSFVLFLSLVWWIFCVSFIEILNYYLLCNRILTVYIYLASGYFVVAYEWANACMFVHVEMHLYCIHGNQLIWDVYIQKNKKIHSNKRIWKWPFSFNSYIFQTPLIP